MIESIYIKNLGPLKEISIPDIKQLTVLIGESGSGKSLLMKTLIFFRYLYKMLNIRWYLKNANINKSHFNLSLQNMLSPELKQYFRRENKDLEVIYSVEINGNRHQISYKKGELVKSDTKKNIPNQDLIFLKESWISELRNVIPEWSSYGKSSRQSKSLDYYFQETYNDFQEATDVLQHIDLDYIGLSLDVERKSDSKKLLFRPKDNTYGPLELKYGSSGIQTSSSIMTIADYFANKFSFKEAIGRSILTYLYESENLTKFNPELEPMEMKKMVHIHIEEPELNLYPNAQCKLIDQLVDKTLNESSDDREIKMIMATHSPYIVNYLNILINRRPGSRAYIPVDQIGVYRLYNGSLQSLIAFDEDGRQFVDTEDLTDQMQAIMEEYSLLTQS